MTEPTVPYLLQPAIPPCSALLALLARFRPLTGHRLALPLSAADDLARRYRRFLQNDNLDPKVRYRYRGIMNPHLLQMLGDHIDTHIDRRAQLTGLADLAHLSVGHFARAFKATIGVSPNAFVRQRRITLVLHVIETSDATFIDIAAAFGFADQSNLSHEFRTHVGVSPTQWRLANRTVQASVREAG